MAAKASRFGWIVLLLLLFGQACAALSGLTDRPVPGDTAATTPTADLSGQAATPPAASTPELPLEPNPMQVVVEWDETAAVSSQPYGPGLPPTGYLPGTLPGGLGFQLNLGGGLTALPDGSGGWTPVFLPDITAAPLISLSGLGFPAALVAGLHLEPSGLRLTQGAILQLDLPPELDTTELVGFAYDGLGENFRLFPMQVLEMPGQAQAHFTLTHFSGVGVVRMDATSVALAKQGVPAVPSLQAEHLLGGMTPAQRQGSDGRWVHQRWFDQGVRPKLDRVRNCETALDAGIELIEWHDSATNNGHTYPTNRFQAEVDAAETVLQRQLFDCLTLSCSLCLEMGEAEERTRMMALTLLLQRLELITGHVSLVDWFGLTGSCYEQHNAFTEFLSHSQAAGDCPDCDPAAAGSPLTCPAPRVE